MKYTVVTLNLNNVEGLKKSVDSVLSQTYTDYEYLVIDGGSNDGSKEFLEKTQGISYWVSEPDKGIYNAMNKSIRLAKGDYIIFINSGDWFYNNQVLEKAAPYLKADFYIGNAIEILNETESLSISPSNLTLDTLLNSFSIHHQATFTKTALLKEHPYNENNKIVSDWEYILRQWFLYQKKYVHLDMTISYYPLDGISYTNKELSLWEREKVINEIFIWYVSTQEQAAHFNDFAWKITKAMQRKPISRDWKVLRISCKHLAKDLFGSLFTHS